MRGAVIPHLSIKVFPTTFTLGRRYTVPRFAFLSHKSRDFGTGQAKRKIIMKKIALKLRSLLLATVCIILASCGASDSSYEAFPMLAVVKEKVNSPTTLKMVGRDGKLTPINLVSADLKSDANNIEYLNETAFSADGAATVKVRFYNEDGYRYFIVYRDGSQPRQIQAAENCEIRSCSSFSEGIAIVSCWDYAKEKYQLTAFDTKGDSLWTKYADCFAMSPFVNGKAFVGNDKRLFLIDKAGKVLSDLSMYYNGNYYIKWINQELYITKWRINALRYGLIPVIQNDNHRLQGIIDLQGNFVIEPKYGNISSYDSDRFVVSMYGEKEHGVVDKDGNVILPFEYTDGLIIDGDYVLGGNIRTKEQGWFNNSGELIIPIKEEFYFHYNYLWHAFDGSDYATFGNNRHPYYTLDKQGNKKFEGKDIRLRFKDNGHEYLIYYPESTSYWGEMPVIMDEEGNEIFNAKDFVNFELILKSNDYISSINSEADTWMVL